MLRRGIRKQQESGDSAMTMKNLLPRLALSLAVLRHHLLCLSVVTLVDVGTARPGGASRIHRHASRFHCLDGAGKRCLR
jgi:hypothetical protein